MKLACTDVWDPKTKIGLVKDQNPMIPSPICANISCNLKETFNINHSKMIFIEENKASIKNLSEHI